MNDAYLERVADDLSKRIGSLVVNNQTVPVHRITRNGREVIVTTEPVQGITKVTSIQLYDEQGGLLTERITNLVVSDQQRLEFRFEFEVKSGEST